MMVEKKAVWMQRRKRVFELVEVTISDGWLNRVYGIVSTLVLLVNLAATIMYTFDYMELHYGGALRMIEAVTVAFFALDFALRVWTAPCKYPVYRSGRLFGSMYSLSPE